jgi:hypothetical protein
MSFIRRHIVFAVGAANIHSSLLRYTSHVGVHGSLGKVDCSQLPFFTSCSHKAGSRRNEPMTRGASQSNMHVAVKEEGRLH